MPRREKTVTYNLADENRGLKERLKLMQETLEKVINERSTFQGELLDVARKLRNTERELEATRHALVLMNENLVERSKSTWTAQIVYEPRIAKGE